MPVPPGRNELGYVNVGHLRDTEEGKNSTFSVSTTAIRLVQSNPGRNGLVLVNNGSTDVYFGFFSAVASGATAAATGGALLRADGGSASFGPLDGYTGPLWAITASGTSVVFVGEW